MIIGKATNDKTNEIVIPILIIRPKFITGSIFDKIKEAKPTTVVIIAKNEGSSFDKTSIYNKFVLTCILYFTFSSLYLSIRCRTIDMVIISCKAIKFEDITVTSQTKNS